MEGLTMESSEIDTTKTNLQYVRQNLMNVLYSSNYCGVCLDSDNDIYSICTDITVEIHGKSLIKSLKNIISEVFYNVTDVPASSYICVKCTDAMIKSYKFIQKTTSSIASFKNYINDFITKADNFNIVVKNVKYNFDNYNAIIVIENLVDSNDASPKKPKINQSDSTKKGIENTAVKVVNVNDIDNKANCIANKKDLTSNARQQKVEEAPKINLSNILSLMRVNFTKKTEASKDVQPKKDIIKLPLEDIMIPRKNGYECAKCKIIFLKYNLWKEHERNYHEKPKPQCKICSKVYDSDRILTEHYKVHNKLRCKICNIFVSDTELIQHLRSKHLNDTHSCEYCDNVYYTAPALIAHMKISHFNLNTVDEDKNPQCLMCLQYFPKGELKTHKCRDKCPDCNEIPCIHYKYLIHFKDQVLNHISKVKCLECDYICRRKDSLIAHVNREHLNHHPYSCHDCGTQFFSNYRLKYHITTFHKNNMLTCKYCDKVLRNDTSRKKHENICQTEKRQFGCRKCTASFNTVDEATNHDKLKHSKDAVPCDLCNKLFLTQDNLRNHKLRSHRSVQATRRINWECLLCDIKFDTKAENRLHMQSHGPDVKYICKVCNIEFEDIKKLQWHSRAHKDKAKRKHKCTICGKEVSMIRHHMLRHRVKKNQSLRCICEKCGKTFVTKDQLRLHKLVHLEETPCKVCTKLVKPSTMQKHLNMHNLVMTNILEKKKKYLKCEHCEYVAPSMSCIEAHVNRHHLKIKPYVCAVCGDAFCAKFHLKLHSRVHSNDRNFTCEICGNKYRFRSSLMKHLFVHSGEKSHICDTCGEGFVTLTCLKEHKLKHFDKTVRCPLCESKFYSLKLMRMHFKSYHWKDKQRMYNPKEILPEEYHYLFEDRRKVIDD